MKLGIIYHAFDTSNGKAYVGQTWDTLDLRKKRHFEDLRRTFVFQNALRKRPNDFVWTVLTSCRTQEEMDQAELYWGEFFDCLWPHGYCLKLGGTGGKHSDVSKQKMREHHARPWLGKKMPQNVREKMRRSHTGKPSGSSGKKWSLEARQRLSEIRKKQRHSQETKDKIGAAHRGMKRSPETCRHISEAKRRKVN